MSERPRAQGAPTDHFDIDRVRKNWERVREPEPVVLPHRFAEASRPIDPFAVGRDRLARVRSMADAQFSARAATLAPFFGQATDALARIEAAAPGSDTSADRELLVGVLGDLEELFEVFAGIGR